MTKSKQQILDRINEFKVDIWSNPNRPDDTQVDECEYCGKKLGKNPLCAHINIDGTIIPIDITEADLNLVGMESQGCFPIGQNCAKKLFGSKINEYCRKLNG